jgi:D-alanyl-D-alanine carboxypeptidase
VATTVLQLVAEHRVSLDAPIGRYVAALVPAALGRAVTVRMLLNHTSGIGDFDTVIIRTPADLITMGETHYTPAELIKLGLSAGSTGAKWSYSNTNYVLAGQIIEKVTGHSYRSEITRRILRPPGAEPRVLRERRPGDPRASPARIRPWTGGTLKDFAHYQMSWASSAGEMVSTVADLDTFYRALLAGRLLPAAQLAQMETTVVQNPANPAAGAPR